MRPPIPPNETERLAALKRHYILDTPPEAALDRITALAARLFSVPISLVTLVDETRQWFKSVYGLDIRETPREIAFCAHAIAGDGVMVVPDATEDARFQDNPLVLGAPDIRFYAGAPLTSPDGFHLGTLCIIDHSPRELSAEQQQVLQNLAATVMDELELRLATITASRREEDHAQISHRLAQVSDRLLLSEEMLRSVLEALPVGVWIADRDGTLVHGNPAGLEVWGGREYVPIERYGEYVAWWPESGRRVAAEEWALARAIRRGETSIGEIMDIQAFGGARKTIRNSAVPLRDRSGAIAGAIAVNEDITDLKRAEEALRRTRDELEGLIQASPLAIICFDKEGRVERWNPAAERMLGWRADEVIGGECRVIPDHLRAEYVELCDRVYNGESLQDYETLRTRKDGAVINVSISAAALHGQSGEITGTIALLGDTTARKAAEAALRESEERYRTLVEMSPSAIVVHDDQRILFVNPAAVTLFGAAGRDDLIARDPADCAHPDFKAVFREKTELALKRGVTGPLREVKVRKLDGTDVHVEAISIPYRYGGQAAVLTVMRDISERHNLEQQLAQAQKMEAVGQLAGGVAHDFNNLLTVIAGYSALLLQWLREPDPARQHVREIAQAAERATALTRQLLAFSRKQVLQPSIIDVNGIVRDSEKMLKRLIGEDIDIRLALGAGELRVLADPGQLVQVIMNLAVNARDAMRDGGALTIETAALELGPEHAEANPGVNPGAYVQLAISDTGVGIDPATLDRIFEPFFTTKGPGAGTGLGLSTVYGIVRQSNGQITVESEVGRGTTFRVRLPRAFEPQPAGAAKPAASAAHGTETILLVEDDPPLRRLTRTILAAAGYKVIEAANGGAALLACEQHAGSIALMITDLIMPGMNGRELAARLCPLRPEMKVLYISGHTDRAAVASGAMEEGVDFVQKPFTPESLRERVRSILDRPIT